MKRIVFSTVLTLLSAISVMAQVPSKSKDATGKFYACWGWNRDYYTVSDLHFEGDGYKFDLTDVQAKDRQSKVSLKKYLFFTQFSVPQTNLKLGYHLNNKYSIAAGFDHMKYVMVRDQTVNINGQIAVGRSEHNGNYNNEPKVISQDFLAYEHTDGLNYVFVEFNRHGNFYSRPKIELSYVFGASPAFLRPRTDVFFLGVQGPNKYHYAGYGMNGKAGVSALFWNRFYIMSEAKGGYINMPDVRATLNAHEKVSQHFGFFQANVLMGFLFGFK